MAVELRDNDGNGDVFVSGAMSRWAGGPRERKIL